MDKKDIKRKTTKQRDPEREVRFCLNCNDMDDLATSEEANDLDQLHERFRNCNETGRFDGDIRANLNELGYNPRLDAERAQALLGRPPRPAAQSVREMAQGLIDRNLV